MAPNPQSILSDPFWRRVATNPALKTTHWTSAQLEALYSKASPEVSEHFGERSGVFQFDAGFNELTAMNLAHIATTEWLEGRLAGLDAETIGIDREIGEREREFRRQGLDPDQLFYLEKGGAS